MRRLSDLLPAEWVDAIGPVVLAQPQVAKFLGKDRSKEMLPVRELTYNALAACGSVGLASERARDGGGGEGVQPPGFPPTLLGQCFLACSLSLPGFARSCPTALRTGTWSSSARVPTHASNPQRASPCLTAR